MLGRYSRIDKCTLVHKDNRYDNCYLITGDGVDHDFEVDITGDLWFNCEFEVENRQTILVIDNLNDLIAFIKSIGQEKALKTRYITGYNINTHLLVGGESDCRVNKDLTFDWIKDNNGTPVKEN